MRGAVRATNSCQPNTSLAELEARRQTSGAEQDRVESDAGAAAGMLPVQSIERVTSSSGKFSSSPLMLDQAQVTFDAEHKTAVHLPVVASLNADQPAVDAVLIAGSERR